MKHALTALFFFSSAAALLAQDGPQLTWQGYVSGSATLYIQGTTVDAQGPTTGAVDRPASRFYAPLPARAQRVEVDVVRGAGRVLISEQPAPANEYTAIVRVDPPGNEHEYYELNFFWNSDSSRLGAGQDRSGRYPTRRGASTDDRSQDDEFSPQHLTWRGQVDHEALVEIRGRRANVRTLRGQRAITDSVDATAPLPRQEVAIQLAEAEGRGRVELVEEPSSRNNYTATVRIVDTDAGADTYLFRVAWQGESRPNRTVTRSRTIDRPAARTDSYSGVLTPNGSESVAGGNRDYGYGENRLIWMGRVDGNVQLVFRGDRVTVNRMSGSPVAEDRLEVGSPLPGSRLASFDVNKLEGRGNVRVVAEPSSYNNYGLTVEISDPAAGAGHYTIEVTWER